MDAMPKHTDESLRAIILTLLKIHPFLWTARICRSLNNISCSRHCRYCKTYANPRKRTRFPFRLTDPCPINLSFVGKFLKKMVVDGLIASKKKILPDGYNSRGYDLFTVYYLPEKDPDRHQRKLSDFFRN
jgi:hypothetical protein